MNEELAIFENLLMTASSRIGSDYFQMPVANAEALYRERVYCYELYHQIRCLWNEFPFSLGGEVDKSGHPYFRRGPYARSKPDFLVHIPGNMDRNLACIEVKPISGDTTGFNNDLKKLTWFCDEANYYRGIFLIYGNDNLQTADAFRAKIAHAIDNEDAINMQRIHIFRHSEIGQQAVRIEL